MAANMYRVGDYVFFETSATAPYQIRRIEELTKTPTGNVEAKVMCFYRRRDMSNALINQADKTQGLEDDAPSSPDGEATQKSNEDGGGLSEGQRHQLKHRELFLSRQIETLPATTIRGKCSVTLFNETETPGSYLGREDAFYYNLVYDNTAKTLVADRGEIKVGGRYQAEVTPLLGAPDKDGERREGDGRDLAQLEELVWRPDHGLAPVDVDKFLLVARSVGTLARAVDACSAIRQPGLAPAAAAASRDVTQAHAHRLLHSASYDLGRAFCQLVTDSGPILCRDQLEDWSAGECSLFEEAMDKYGKDFYEIRRDYLPWKSMRAIVEYFYMWKTTDRYVQRKRLKASEAERKLKQVYIPNYTKPNPAVLYNAIAGGAARPCESCQSTAPAGQWYAWGPAHLSCRLCANCWSYWKRYGGLRNPTRLEKATSATAATAAASQAAAGVRTHRCTVSGCGQEFRLRPQLVRHLAAAHNLDEASLGQLQQQQQHYSNGGANGKAVKSVKSMLMQANATTRLARLLCPELLRLRRLARRPFDARFDAKPALRELPQRYRATGRTAQQLLLPGSSSGLNKRVGRRLGEKSILRRSAGEAFPDCLKRDERPPAQPIVRRTFPLVDAAKLAEFFRRLDEEQHDERRAAALQQQPPTQSQPPPLPTPTPTVTVNGSYGGTSQPRKRQICDPSSANGAADGSSAPATGGSVTEEIFLCGTKRCRLSLNLTTTQLRRAGRRPFKPMATAKPLLLTPAAAADPASPAVNGGVKAAPVVAATPVVATAPVAAAVAVTPAAAAVKA